MKKKLETNLCFFSSISNIHKNYIKCPILFFGENPNILVYLKISLDSETNYQQYKQCLRLSIILLLDNNKKILALFLLLKKLFDMVQTQLFKSNFPRLILDFVSNSFVSATNTIYFSPCKLVTVYFRAFSDKITYHHNNVSTMLRKGQELEVESQRGPTMHRNYRISSR